MWSTKWVPSRVAAGSLPEDSLKLEVDQRTEVDSVPKIEIPPTPNLVRMVYNPANSSKIHLRSACWLHSQNDPPCPLWLSKLGSAGFPKPLVSPFKNGEKLRWFGESPILGTPHLWMIFLFQVYTGAPCFSIIPGWFTFSKYKCVIFHDCSMISPSVPRFFPTSNFFDCQGASPFPNPQVEVSQV